MDNSDILPKEVEVKLGASSYERRKAAAHEIENLIKALVAKGEIGKINALIAFLGDEFVRSPSPNYRKGGLIGLAACAIGLTENAKVYLDLLVEPVFKCFDDPESRVRYYACESMFNIVKVCREHTLRYFNKIFDGLCKLCVDVNIDVKNGVGLLDRLVKDIVTECDDFDVASFIPLLQKYISQTNPYIRHTLVMWITALDSVPGINMLEWLPTFLDGLFNMLSDGNRQIRQAADLALGEFLKDIKSKDSPVEFGPCEVSSVGMISILVAQCKSRHNFNRVTAVHWIYEFVPLGKEKLVPFFPILVEAMLHCISDDVAEIKENASNANSILMDVVQKAEATIDLKGILEKLTMNLLNDNEPTRLASLNWISMLLEKLPSEMSAEVDAYFYALLRTLNDEEDVIVELDIQVIALICRHNGKENFRRILKEIYSLFASDQTLLETRGSLILRHLCRWLTPERVYRELADIIRTTCEENVVFASVIVQMLNIILLTANELDPLRTKLKRCQGVTPMAEFSTAGGNNGKNVSTADRDESRSLFTTLFNSWCHSPVSALSLCFLAQAYDLASVLITNFGMADISVGFLMQVDKLVQLLESPIFIHVRLEMLEKGTERHFALMKTLYGMLMLLPQSAAFKTLQNRLAAVASMPSMEKGRKSADPSVACKEYIHQFVTVLAKHQHFQHEALSEKKGDVESGQSSPSK